MRSRTCTNPKPKGKGKTCKEQDAGPAKQSKKCNPLPCGRFLSFLLATSFFIVYEACSMILV